MYSKTTHDWSVKVFSIREHQYSGEDLDLAEIRKIRRFSEMLNLSDEFFNDLESFAKRNKIEGENFNAKVCMPCFKAFLIKRAHDHSIPRGAIKFFAKCFNCESGHFGYYMDKNILTKI